MSPRKKTPSSPEAPALPAIHNQDAAVTPIVAPSDGVIVAQAEEAPAVSEFQAFLATQRGPGNRMLKLRLARDYLIEKNLHVSSRVTSLQMPQIGRWPDMQTACVGRDRYGSVQFYFDEVFFDALSVKDLAFILAHEASHIFLQHVLTKKDNMVLWNIATDLVINTLLVNAYGLEVSKELTELTWFPEKIKLDRAFVLRSLSAEDIYDRLLPHVQELEQQIKDMLKKMILSGDVEIRQMGGGGGQGSPGDGPTTEGTNEGGGGLDNHQYWGPLTEAALRGAAEQLANEGYHEAPSSPEHSKGCGDDPLGLNRFFNKIRRPANWERILQQFVAGRPRRITCYDRPRRRLLATYPKMIFPTETTEYDHYLVVYVDCSGSVDEELLARFSAVLDRAPSTVTIDGYSFDTRIYDWNWAKGDKPRGGGGTDFQAVVNHAQQLSRRPDGVVVLTDGICGEPTVEHPRRWLWLTSEQAHTAASGTWIQLDRVAIGTAR